MSTAGRHVPVALASMLIAAGAGAQPCAKDEDPLWSCTAKSKNYALCASKDAGPDRGHVQYRVQARGATEFVYPETRRPPQGVFHYTLYNRSAAVSFENGPYGYTLWESIDGRPGSIEVTRDGQRVGVVQCATSSDTLTLTTSIERFKAMGIAD